MAGEIVSGSKIKVLLSDGKREYGVVVAVSPAADHLEVRYRHVLPDGTQDKEEYTILSGMKYFNGLESLVVEDGFRRIERFPWE